MKTRYYNVQIEVYAYGAVKAAVMRSKLAGTLPDDGYVENPDREVYSLWFGSKVEARDMVAEALAMNGEQGEAA